MHNLQTHAGAEPLSEGRGGGQPARDVEGDPSGVSVGAYGKSGPLGDGQVLRFRGRNVEELTRDELLVAAYRLHGMVERERKWAKSCSEMSELFMDTAAHLAGVRR